MPMPDFAINPKRLGAILERQEGYAARRVARGLPADPDEEPMAPETLEDGSSAEEPTETLQGGFGPEE